MAPKYTAPRLTMPIGQRDHIEGPLDAPMVLLEYGDYQCPYCGAAYPVVKRVQKELGDGLRFVFRNFPITNSHPQAMWAAETAEAAGAQGKFWEMHDYLYENQGSLGDDAFFNKYETKLKLDVARLNREVAQQKHFDRINEDYVSGIRSGVNGTPTFFVNGTRYDDYPGFHQFVEALRKARGGRTGEKKKAAGLRRR